MPFHRDIGGPEAHLEVDLSLGTLQGVGQLRQDFQASCEVADRLGVGGTPCRTAPGLMPIAERLLRVSRLGIVVGYQLRLRDLREALLEQPRDLRVIVSTRSAQQGLICGVLDQRVLERVGSVGGCAAAKDQP